MKKKPFKHPFAVPATVDAAEKAGLPAVDFDLEAHIARISAQMGTHFVGDQPGDVAWTGPCEHGQRTIAYYDDAMQPTIYKTCSC